MVKNYITESLIKQKVTDYRLNSTLMPKKARFFHNILASTIGNSVGKTIPIYRSMLEQIADGRDVVDVQKSIRTKINSASKINLRLPTYGSKPARICGLAALNYSGMADTEISFYTQLQRDLQAQGEDGRELTERIVGATKSNPESYLPLLADMREASRDYAALMGLSTDDEHAQALFAALPKQAETYFRMVSKIHKGNKLGLSWPFAIKDFSQPILDQFSHNSVYHAAQEGVEKDFGYKKPEADNLGLINEEIRNTATVLKESKIPLVDKWRVTATLPATLFYLSSVNAHAAAEVEDGTKVHTHGEVMEAVTTAGALGFLCGDEAEDATTTFGLAMTTLL